MKKRILILSSLLVAFSLTAFAYINWNNSNPDQESQALEANDFVNSNNREADLDLFYRISNRWSTMTKEDLNQVKSILDIFQEDGTHMREDYRNITISVLHNDKDVRDIDRFEMGQTVEFNGYQLELLRSCDYSTNLRITTLSKRTNIKTGDIQNDSILRYMTIVPEKEAEFTGGFEALIEYLKEGIKDKTSIIKKEKLQPGKVFFTVTENGAIDNVKIVETSGYPSIDKELKNIVTNMPNKWTPAQNLNGKKVHQEFVLFFGLEGC